MKECKCGCGGIVQDGQTFLLGHNLKWKAKQKNKNSVLSERSLEAARKDRINTGPLKAYQDQVIPQISGGIRLSIIMDPDQSKPKQPELIKEITEELPQKEEIIDETEVLLDDLITAAKENTSKINPSISVQQPAPGGSSGTDRTQTGIGTKRKLIVLFLSVVVIVGSYVYFKGGI